MKIDNIIQKIYNTPTRWWRTNTSSIHMMITYESYSPEVSVYHFSDTDKELFLFERVINRKISGYSSIRLYYMGLEFLFPDTDDFDYCIVGEC